MTITGGTVIYGGSGVGQVSNEAQSYVFSDSDFSAGAAITVMKGRTVITSFTPAIDGRYLVISTPDIENGEEYTINAGTNSTVTVTAGTGGGMGGMGRPGGGQGEFPEGGPRAGQDSRDFYDPAQGGNAPQIT